MRFSAISTRGRVTIPAELRERLDIKPGTHINWSKEQGRLVLTLDRRTSAQKIVVRNEKRAAVKKAR
jgi:AbrB family looped-hinge helix DNA binding protein